MKYYIYAYVFDNIIKYVGQTNNLKRRKKQHLQDSFHIYKGHEVSHNLPLHCAIRKYGINNFTVIVLEEGEVENRQYISDRETYWIKYYNTLAPNGYNLKAQHTANPGEKNKSKIPLEVQDAIINDLLAGKKQSQIAKTYGLSSSYIGDINWGRCLYRDELNYPLYTNMITEDEMSTIIYFIQETQYSFSEIAKYMDRNSDSISKINLGKMNLKMIRKVYQGDFPIRKNSKQGYILGPVETICGQTESMIAIDT